MPGTKLVASNRYRFLQYTDFFNKSGIECSLFYIDTKKFKGEEPYSIYSFSGMLNIMLNFIKLLKRTWKYDKIIIQRHLVHPCLPLTLFLPENYRKKIILDLDDNVYYRYPMAYSLFVRSIKRIIAGNSYLADYIRKYNNDCIVIPTAVDTERYCYANREKNNSLTCCLGWIGSPSGVAYLNTIIPVLERISCNYNFKLYVVSDFSRAKKLESQKIKIECKQWNEITEVEKFHLIDIGLMPLPDTPFTRGKCAYKALQYMSCGLPSIISNVGMNGEVIEDGVDGFLYNDEKEFENKLIKLLENSELRFSMGRKAREKIKKKYSVDILKNNFFDAIIK